MTLYSLSSNPANRIKIASQIEETISKNIIYAYRNKIGKIKPAWYQDAVHQGGFGEVGTGALKLGRVAKRRFVFYPNQVGKSFCGIADDLMIALGIHPYIKLELPVHVAIATTSHLKSIQVLRPLVRKMLPHDIIDELDRSTGDGNWYNEFTEKPSRLELPKKFGGSSVHFMSYDQDPMEYEGLTLHAAHCDEEPPQQIYEQLKIRLLRHNGYFICTMTPWREEGTMGVSWTADFVLNNHLLPQAERDGEIWIAPNITMYDSPWLSKEAVDSWKKSCKSEEEFRARFYGMHLQRTGKVFKDFRSILFDPKKPGDSGHLISGDFIVPRGWQRYLFLDPASPSGTTAAIWVAVAHRGVHHGIQFKDGDYIIYREYKKKDLTVPQHTQNILSLNEGEQLFRKYMDGRFAQQSADAFSGQTYSDMYRKQGLFMLPWASSRIEAEIEATQQYIVGTMDRVSPQGGLFVSENCRLLLYEIDHYVHHVHRSGALRGERKLTEPKKTKDIHLIDCLKAACKLRLTPLLNSTDGSALEDMHKEISPITGF